MTTWTLNTGARLRAGQTIRLPHEPDRPMRVLKSTECAATVADLAPGCKRKVIAATTTRISATSEVEIKS